MTTDELVNLLVAHRLLGTAPREELRWIAEHGTLRQFQQGESVCSRTEVVDCLHILLSGRMSIYVKRGGGVRKTMEWTGGDVWGILPYSRMTTPPGDTFAEEPTEVVTITRDQLPELIRNCYQVTSSLVHVMTDRARRFTSTDLRDEKMRSLGKLAAGFAHEVNNPASAALRDAKSLAATLAEAQEAARELLAARMTDEQLAELDILWRRTEHSPDQFSLNALELADREDALAAWLLNHGSPEGLSEELARTPLSIADLQRLADAVPATTLSPALHWIASASAGRALVANIERAATRIHTLVAAAKGFTHMDRAQDLEEVEIPRGITDAAALLEGKARGKSVTIRLRIDNGLPPVRGFAAEINQIWMNLLDNAIDASPSRGEVAVEARLDGSDVVVTVLDAGPGIPAEIKENIFDPFFTTKPIGEGTGLGLDIVRRVILWHNGEITVESIPGRTLFSVRLPIAGATETR